MSTTHHKTNSFSPENPFQPWHTWRRTTPASLILGCLAIFGLLWLSACHDHDHKGHNHKKAKEHKGHDDHQKAKEHKGHDDHKGHKEHDEHKGEVKLGKQALRQVKLEIAKVEHSQISGQEISAVGRISLPPLAISRVGSRASGRVLRLYVELGQQVRRGQALAMLDSPSVGLARAKYLRASALLRLADVEFKRTSRLKKIGVASSQRLLATRVARERAQIDLRAARAQLDVLGLSSPKSDTQPQLSGRFLVRAPFAGEVTLLPQSLGAWVGPQDSILRVEQRKEVWALLEVYARDLPYVKVGQSVHLYGPGIHDHLEGKISYLASRFERGAQTLEARVVLPNPNNRLRPGQYVYGLIQRHHQDKDHKGHDHKEHKDHKDKDHKGHKDHKDKDHKDHKDHKDKDHKDKDHKDKEHKEHKGHKEHKDHKDHKSSGVAKDLPGKESNLVIPEGAVQRLGQGQVVFVVGDAPGHFQVRTVVTVEAPHGKVRVLYGLKAGERVVVRGSFLLKSELMRASLESEHGHSH